MQPEYGRGVLCVQTGLPAQETMCEHSCTQSNDAEGQPADSTRQLFPLAKGPIRITLHVAQRDAFSLRELVYLVSRKVDIVYGHRSVRCFILNIRTRTPR